MSEVTIDNVNIKFASDTSKATDALKKLSDRFDKLIENVSKSSTSLTKLSNTINSLKKNTSNFDLSKWLNLGAFTVAINKAGKEIYKFMQSSADYISNFNRLNATMGAASDKAQEFVNSFSSMLSLDPSSVMNYMGTFKNLVSSFGIASDSAYIMSKNLTQLSYDIAAFDGIPIEDAMKKLKSGISGELEPMRAIGIALDQATLQQTAYRLGIEKSVTSMTRLEKTQLLYYQIMVATESRQGYFAKALLTPAIAIQILKNQFTQLTRAIGNVFLPLLMQAVPIIMAVTQLLTQAAQAIANFFGYDKLFKQSTAGISAGFGNIETGIEDIGDAASGTKKKVKEMIAPFDDLNVIDFGDNTGSGSGWNNIIGGGLDIPTPNYDVTATNKFQEQAEKIKKIFMDLLPIIEAIGGALLSWKLSNKILNFIDLFTGGKLIKTGGIAKISFGVALTVSGITLFVNGIKKALSGEVNAKTIGEIITGALGIGAGAVMVLDGIRTIKLAIPKKTAASVSETIASTAGIANKTTKASKAFKLPQFKSIIKGLAELGLVIAAVVFFTEALGELTKSSAVRQNITRGMEVLKEVFGGLLKVAPMLALTIVAINALSKTSIKSMAIGLADLAIAIGGVELLVLAIGGILSIPGFQEASTRGINSIVEVFKGLGSVAGKIGIFGGILMAAGLLGGAGVAAIAIGLADTAILIGGLELVVVAIGKLMSNGNFSQLASKGIAAVVELLSGLGKALGGFLGGIAGGLIGGALQGIMDSLGQLGSELTEFMDNAQGFFQNLSLINEGTMASMKTLAQSILIITATQILDALTSWFTGGINFSEFGKQLKDFGQYFADYYEEVKGINPDIIEATSTAAKSIASIYQELPDLGGMKQFFMGGKDMASFSIILPILGKSLKLYEKMLGSGVNNEVVNSSINAAKSIAGLYKELPDTGGLKQLFTGKQDLKGFAEILPSLATNIKKYSDNLSGGINEQLISSSVNVAKTIASLYKELPNTGGLKQLFEGRQNLKGFAEVLPSLATNIKKYSDNLSGGINEEVINSSVNAAKSIAGLYEYLPKDSGWFAKDDLKKFGETLESFGNKFFNYYKKISGVNMNTVNSVTNALNSLINNLLVVQSYGLGATLESFANSLSKSSTGISTYFKNTFTNSQAASIGYSFGASLGNNIKQGIKDYTRTTFELSAIGLRGNLIPQKSFSLKAYASGGYPDEGEFFLAREGGPEFVGKIGNQTAVANNDQITSAIRQASYEGLSQALKENPQTHYTDVRIGNDKVYSGYGEYSNRQSNKYGISTIKV